jgi:PAS domain S-box-containing protein
MSGRVAAFDWRQTPLGAPETWSPALRVSVELLLGSRFPGCLIWGPALTMIYNDAFELILGEKPSALGRSFADVWSEVWDALSPLVDRAFQGEATFIEDFELEINRHGYAEQAFFTFCYSPVRDERGVIVGMLDTVIETTGKVVATRRAEDWANTLEKQVSQQTADRDRLWKLTVDPMVTCDRHARIRSVNPAWTQLLGWTPLESIDRNLGYFLHADDRDATDDILAGLPETVASFKFETRCRCHDGSLRLIEWSTVPDDQTLLLVGRDLTLIREQAEALKKSEIALYQAQKMESVGQLTGGVAHDFNNLLQVISGNLQLLSKSLLGNKRVEKYIANAQAGVQRGAKLSSQLLAFARRQPLEPRIVNVARLIPGIEDMLHRTIGEGIEMETVISGSLWNCFVDSAQMENAILNLAINARDAMNGVGRLTIECANAHLDQAYAQAHDDVASGPYVMLAVADTGCGMSEEVLGKVFEPFFSTKPEGRGTGLGLSMVFGFVKQSGGHVKLYSEIGHGTVVKIYLPRVVADEDAVDLEQTTLVVPGSETILVAEDDDAVRQTVVEMLTGLGYQVLQARDAASALVILESGVNVDMLFTDVVMPGSVRSPELAARARQLIPGIAVLFTSGYTEDAIVHGGKLNAGVELIGKPYTEEALGLKIRSVLARAERPLQPSAV